MQLDQSITSNQKPKFDVLKIYDDPEVDASGNSSIFRGGLDTGIDLGKFILDTSNMKNCVINPPNQNYSQRFIGPYCRT